MSTTTHKVWESGLTWLKFQWFRLIMRSSADAEKSGEEMACKIRLERKRYQMLWILDYGFGDASNGMLGCSLMERPSFLFA